MSNSKFNAAFIAAYGTNVGGADTKTIERFNELVDAGVDADHIHNEIGSDYPSLMDALGMFGDGAAYGSTQLFEKVPPEYLALADSLQGMIEVFGDSFGDGESETVDAARQALIAIGYVHPSVRNAPSQADQSKVKTVHVCDLTGTALDWAVAQYENKLWLAYENAVLGQKPTPPRPSEYLRDCDFSHEFSPSTNWSYGGPIVEREMIQIGRGVQSCNWSANQMASGHAWIVGSTPLISAMRCFVRSNLGSEVQIPIEYFEPPYAYPDPEWAKPKAANDLKVETVILPAYWGSALVNNDFSGLDAEAEKSVKAWIEAHPEYGSCLSASDAVVIGKFDGLTCDVLEFSFPVKALAS